MPGSDVTRKKIRDNVVTLLKGNTTAGNSVFSSRINKAFIEELPGIFIYTANDSPVYTRKNEVTFDRKVTLVIEVLVAQKQEADIVQDIADTILGEVEDILLPNPFLQIPAPWLTSPGPKIVSYTHLGPTNISRVDDLQEDLFGEIMELECEYHYEQNVIATLQDWLTFQAKYQIGDMTSEHLVDFPPP